MDFQGIDEFGREYCSVETAPGRLGIALRETEKGHIVVDSCENMKTIAATCETLSQSDRQRMQRAYEAIQQGDRLVQIDGLEVIHTRLNDVISRLGKLAARRRQLTFARYSPTQFFQSATAPPTTTVTATATMTRPSDTSDPTSGYDIERFVLVKIPAGPMGLVLNSQIGAYGAFIEDFQVLADGTLTKLAKHQRLYRGCQLFQVNGTRVATWTRDQVVAHLTCLKDQPKELIFYQATCNNCESLFQVEWKATSNTNTESYFDDQQPHKCVVTRAFVSSASSTVATIVQPGDVLLRVNNVDVSCKSRAQTLQLLAQNDPSGVKTLIFYHPSQQVQPVPECQKLSLEPGALGLNLDPATPLHARIAGFTTPNDAIRKCFAHCANFIPGSFIISINQLDVFPHSLHDISTLLGKLRDSPKEIVVANGSLLQQLLAKRKFICVQVPKGPLGLQFDPSKPDLAIVSGFYDIEPGKKSILELQGQVPVGSVLVKINDLNITSLTLAQVSEFLKKLANQPKRLMFLNHDALRSTGLPRKEQDAITKFVDVRVVAGPLGIDLKHSLSNKVMLDRLTPNAQPVLVQHGGVFEGAQLCEIDGFDLTDLTLDQVFAWLKLLAKHDKVLTFSLSSTKRDQLWTNCAASKADTLRQVVTSKELSVLEFEFPVVADGQPTLDAHEALVGKLSGGSSTSFFSRITGPSSPRDLQADASVLVKQIPVKSRLVAIDSIDVRCMTLSQILASLDDLQGIQKTLTFDIKPGISTITVCMKAPPTPVPTLTVTTPPPGSPMIGSGITDLRVQTPGTTPASAPVSSPRLSTTPSSRDQVLLNTPPSSPATTTTRPVEPEPAQLEMLQKAADALLSPLSSSSPPSSPSTTSSLVYPQRMSQTSSSPISSTAPKAPTSPHTSPPAPLVSSMSPPMLFTNETMTKPSISPQKIKSLSGATQESPTKSAEHDKYNLVSTSSTPTSLTSDKPVLEDVTSSMAKDMEFTVSMSTWNGSRTWSRLLVDVEMKKLVLEPITKGHSTPTSPRKANSIAMNEIVSFEIVKGSPRRNVLSAAGSDDTKVVLHLNKKKIEFEMRFVEETKQLKQTLHQCVPTLHLIN